MSIKEEARGTEEDVAERQLLEIDRLIGMGPCALCNLALLEICTFTLVFSEFFFSECASVDVKQCSFFSTN